MIQIYFRSRLALSAIISSLFIVVSDPALAKEQPVWQLQVTTADVDGSCLLDQKWVKVGGRYHQWQLIRIDEPTNYTGKIDGKWQFIQGHAIRMLSQTDFNDNRDNAEFFNLKYLDEESLNTDRRMANEIANTPAIQGIFDHVRLVDSMRNKFSKPKLLPATVVRYVPELELYRLNEVNNFNPFQENMDGRKVIVPIGISVCDLKINYLMKGAKARYIKNLLGQKKLIMDETVPYSPGKESFAKEWMRR